MGSLEYTTPQTVCSLSDLKFQFEVHNAVSELVLKGEDVAFQNSGSGYKLYAVSDGHAGSQCSAFVKNEFWKILEPKLPTLQPNASHDDTFGICKKIRKAVLSAFVEVDASWYKENVLSGTTLTVVLILGRLLTVANVGDSDCYLHDGSSFLQITKSHRVEYSVVERNRLKAAKVKLASLSEDLKGPAEEGKVGLGPVRVWPGGLAVSRSIGDADITPHVLCLPHIRQLMLPTTGCRLILATDGLWDYSHNSKVKKTLKNKTIKKCAGQLVYLAGLIQGVVPLDDTTVSIVDLLPNTVEDFKHLFKKKQQSISPLSTLTKLIRLRGTTSKPRSPPKMERDNKRFLSDVDGISMVAPDQLVRRKKSMSKDKEDVHLTTNDFTIHGANFNSEQDCF